MEKRRRQRINSCLEQLKLILMDVTKKEVSVTCQMAPLFEFPSQIIIVISAVNHTKLRLSYNTVNLNSNYKKL